MEHPGGAPECLAQIRCSIGIFFFFVFTTILRDLADSFVQGTEVPSTILFLFRMVSLTHSY